ncbi:MAG: DivIVA domain-containing protein [Solirubrobacterales bacterium]
MLSPVELRNRDFGRSLRGYNDREVDSFLAKVAEEFERIYRENAELKEVISRNEFEMARYKRIEDTLNQTMVLAQQAAEEIKANAMKEAQMILDQARVRISEIFMAYEEILSSLKVYRAEIKSFVSSQSELVDRQEKRIEELMNFFYSKDMKDMLSALSKVRQGSE